MASLGVETDEEVVLLLLGNARLRTLVHAAGIVVARLFGLAVHGQDARIESVPDAEVVGGHLLAIEQPRVVGAVTMVAHVEVEHPASIGTQLVVAAVERVAQGKLSTGEAFGTDDDLLTLHHQTVGREEFHVEQTAHVGGLVVVGPHHVGFIPQRVAHEITLVVGVEIHLLLHLRQG